MEKNYVQNITSQVRELLDDDLVKAIEEGQMLVTLALSIQLIREIKKLTN